MGETEPVCTACSGSDMPHDKDCPKSPVCPFVIAIPEFLEKLSDMTEVDRMKTCLVACLEAWAMSKNGPQKKNVATAMFAGGRLLMDTVSVLALDQSLQAEINHER